MWVQDVADLDISLDDHFYNWLAKPYSVSKVFKELCQQLSVQVISQQEEPALADEQQLLNIKEDNSLIRQVYLCGDGVPWSYGRVIVPQATYQQYKNSFDNLGGSLIGETMLYGNPDAVRGPFEYAKINIKNELFNLALQGVELAKLSHLWGRRSVFQLLQDYRLLVMEIYLPPTPSFPIF
jgi:chorismate--pyruvate lyase